MTGFLDGQVIESGGYVIQNSLRFSAASSQDLTRTPSVAGNRKTWTWSGWVKFSVVDTNIRVLFGAYSSSADSLLIYQSNSAIVISTVAGTTVNLTTSAVFRDPSAWYHIVVAFDSTQATAADRVKIYVNGELKPIVITASPPLNYDSFVNASGVIHYHGRSFSPAYYFDGYMAKEDFVDGQGLTPLSFAETNIETGEWVAKPYTGTYGTNGFYLPFSDGTSTTSLGYDESGNNNDWTLTNFTRSAGVNDCWMKDVPSGNGSVSGVQPSGNYAVLNPLKKSQAGASVTRGNLAFLGVSGSYVDTIYGSIAIKNTGKYYWEITGAFVVGINNQDINPVIDQSTGRLVYNGSAGSIVSGTTTLQSGLATVNSTDVVGVAVDLDNSEIKFYKNNVQLGTAVSITATDTWFPFVQNSTSYTSHINFGQRSFAYTPPTGFKALCTSNLPMPVAIKKGGKHVEAKTRTGTGSAYDVTDIEFQPDLVITKSRSAATDWAVYDSVRGVQKQLEFNTTSAETTETTGLTAFNSDGYSGGALAQMNTNGATYIDYLFKAGGAPVSNTDGSITSQVSANVTAGFSVVTYTGTGANATVGHGLGKAPKLVIVKVRNNTYEWKVWHQNLSSGNQLILNSTAAQASDTTVFTTTIPTSTVFSIGTNVAVNQSTANYVAYCFAEIEGFSKFGSYTGNGSADGPFVYTGFKPRWILWKRTDAAADWYLVDTERGTSNVIGPALSPNTATAEVTLNAGTGAALDILSNGFKFRGSNAAANASGGTYIYMAFAECPINYANAR